MAAFAARRRAERRQLQRHDPSPDGLERLLRISILNQIGFPLDNGLGLREHKLGSCALLRDLAWTMNHAGSIDHDVQFLCSDVLSSNSGPQSRLFLQRSSGGGIPGALLINSRRSPGEEAQRCERHAWLGVQCIRSQPKMVDLQGKPQSDQGGRSTRRDDGLPQRCSRLPAERLLACLMSLPAE